MTGGDICRHLSYSPPMRHPGRADKQLFAALLAMVFLASTASASPETDFWAWFKKEEPRLFTFESNQEAVFDSLGKAMHRVNPDLTFEFGPVVDGKREFVISAGGIASAFPAVESLFRAAPSLPRWTWVKFRPRREGMFDVGFAGKTVKVGDIRYLMAKDEARVGVMLFFKDYKESEKETFGQIGFLMLDQAVGEFAVETQIGFIEFANHDSSYFKQSRPFAEFRDHFDEYWAAK
jgi:hypothetical protein